MCIVATLILHAFCVHGLASWVSNLNEQILLMISRHTTLVFVYCIGTCHICCDMNIGVILTQIYHNYMAAKLNISNFYFYTGKMSTVLAYQRFQSLWQHKSDVA